MTVQELKEKLLATKCFIDNEYLDKYCELIKQNESTEKQENKTNWIDIFIQSTLML